MVQSIAPTSTVSCFSCITIPLATLGSCVVQPIEYAGSLIICLAQKITDFVTYIFSLLTSLTSPRIYETTPPPTISSLPAPNLLPPLYSNPTPPTIPREPTAETVRVGAEFLFNSISTNDAYHEKMITPAAAQQCFARELIANFAFHPGTTSQQQNLSYFIQRGIGIPSNRKMFLHSLQELQAHFNALEPKEKISVQERFRAPEQEVTRDRLVAYSQLVDTMRDAFNRLPATAKVELKNTVAANRSLRINANTHTLVLTLRRTLQSSRRFHPSGQLPTDISFVERSLAGIIPTSVPAPSAPLPPNPNRPSLVTALYAALDKAMREMEGTVIEENTIPCDQTLMAVLGYAVATNFMAADKVLEKAHRVMELFIRDNPDFIASAHAARERYLAPAENSKPTASSVTKNDVDFLLQYLSSGIEDNTMKKALENADWATAFRNIAVVVVTQLIESTTPLTDSQQLPDFMRAEIHEGLTYVDAMECLRNLYRNFSPEDKMMVNTALAEHRKEDLDSLDPKEQYLCEVNGIIEVLTTKNQAFIEAAKAAIQIHTNDFKN